MMEQQTGMEGVLELRRQRREKRRRRLRGVLQGLSFVGVTLLSLAVFVFGGSAMIIYGPSQPVRDLFVITVMETSAAKFLATTYLSNQEIDAIIQANSVQTVNEVTDVTMVEVPDTKTEPEKDEEPIQVEEVVGPTFKGKMMIVRDPSRVYLATSGTFGAGASGKRVEEMIERDGAVGGVNAGGFVDDGGVGNGGQPLGLVISQGEYLAGGRQTATAMAGFDGDNRLVVGNLTGQQALDMGLRDAVSFGPVLIVNGKRAEVEGTGGGVNPRTAIGQRADGAVLLLVIDGRQPHSIGATYKDIIDVMEQYEAVNACNMDGGSSSLMFYQGELITTCASLYGSRQLPTAWLVKGEGD